MRVKKIFGSIFLVISVMILMGVTLGFLLEQVFSPTFVKNNLILFNLLAMLFFSLVLIFAISRGRLEPYGFRVSFDFPIIRVILCSLIIGFISSLIITVFDFSIENAPWADMSNFKMIVNVWLIASVSEEVFFRGLIQGYLYSERKHGLKIRNVFFSLPVIVSAILFGLLHLMLLTAGADPRMVTVVVLSATIIGLKAGYYREKSNSLLPAIIIHTCFNVGGSFMAIIL